LNKQDTLQKHRILALNEVGYRTQCGTDTANLPLINTLETAWDDDYPIFGCSWDVKRAFDSASKPTILLSRQRLRLPFEIALPLLFHGLNSTKLSTKNLAFKLKRSTCQGGIHSPFTWPRFSLRCYVCSNTPWPINITFCLGNLSY